MRNTESKRSNRGNREAHRGHCRSLSARRFSRSLSLEPLEARVLLSVAPELIDLNASGASSPSDFVQVGNLTFFVAEDATYGRELWATDGTPEGTSVVKDICEGSDSSNPRDLVEFNGELFFVADDGETGQELWKSDGTEAGTVLVCDINPGEGYQYPYGYGTLHSFPHSLTESGGMLFFAAEDADHGSELWMTDGTEAGTVLVLDIATGTYTNDDGTYPDSSNPRSLVDVDGTLFFTADDGESGRELWKSDGTAAGTVLVKDIFSGTYDYYNNGYYYGQRPNASQPDKLTAVDGTLFFIAEDDSHGTELWKSDGTASGTVLVKDVREGSYDGLDQYDSLASIDGTLFFSADNGTSGKELWKTDGTESGTVLVKDIYPGGQWYDTYNNGIWSTSYAPYSSAPQDFTNVDGVIFFTAANGTNGRELWMTDGTTSGTAIVKDLYSGTSYDSSSYSYVPNSSDPQHLTNVAGTVYFAADDGTNGVELWRTDGTESGTVLVEDIYGGSDSSNPSSLTAVRGTLYFAADDGTNGEELWVLVDTVIVEDATAHLSIFIDGEAVQIPADVGVDSDGNISAIYTTDDQGRLQISRVDDEPITKPVTLGDFFETWRTNAGLAGNNSAAVFNGEQILGYHVDDEYSIQMFVDGQANRQFDEYAVQDGDEIVIVYTSNEVVSLNTNLGSILIELYEEETPITVDNFLNYVNDGDYINSFFHRSVPEFVIQGGGYTTSYTYFYGTYQFSAVPTDGPIQNEPGISNTEGTVAMAKLSGDPNSATSQFFVNLDDNSFLDTEDYGSFTVFGRVLDMTTVEAIEALDVNYSYDSPYGELPLTGGNELVVIESIGGEGDLSGTSFEDGDLDGAQGSGESGLAGVVVFADENDNGLLDDGEFSTTTDSEGDWQLRLPAGTYIIRQESADDLYPTTGEATNGHTVTVEIGREIGCLDFANIDNAPPEATVDAYSVNEDATLRIYAADGVLANDTDAEDDDLVAVLVDDAQHGTLTLDANGSFTYTPDADFYGTDTFSYRAQDDYSQSSTVEVTITVEAQADKPTAVDDEFTVSEGDETHDLDVLDNDHTDPDGSQALTIISVTQGSEGGTVAISDGGLSVEYTPGSAFSGTETFTYTIEDTDGLTDQATVTMTVDDDAVGDDGAAGSISGYVYIDSDGDGQRDDGELGVPGSLITLTGVDDDGNSVSVSVLTSSDGAYSFDGLAPGTYEVTQTQPEALLDGEDTIGSLGGTVDDDRFSEIVVGEGEESTENNFGERGLRPQFVTLSLFLASTPSPEEYLWGLVALAEERAGNTELADLIRQKATDVPASVVDDVPEANNDSYNVDEDEILTVDATEGVLANDSDPDGDALTASVYSYPSYGSLTLSSDGSFVYVPNANFNGTDSFTYTASDGVLESDAATVTITVEGENDPPYGEDDEYSTDEDEVLDVDAENGVLANDTDADGSPASPLTSLVITEVNYHPHDATDAEREVNDDFDSDDFEFIELENVGDATIDLTGVEFTDGITFDFTASDVTELAPGETVLVVANLDAFEARYGTELNVAGEFGSGALNNGGETIVLVDSAGSTIHEFSYDDADGWPTAADGDGYTLEVVDVLGDYDDPANWIASDELGGTPGTGTDPTAAVDYLMAQLVDGPDHGELTFYDDGSFIYTPDEGFSGTDSFTYKASDGAADSNEATVTIVVTATEAEQ